MVSFAMSSTVAFGKKLSWLCKMAEKTVIACSQKKCNLSSEFWLRPRSSLLPTFSKFSPRANDYHEDIYAKVIPDKVSQSIRDGINAEIKGVTVGREHNRELGMFV